MPPSQMKRDAFSRVDEKEITCNDVLMGRGAAMDRFDGNVKFRALLRSHWGVYRLISTSHSQRVDTVRQIVATVQASNGRFLRKIASSDEEDANRSVSASWEVVSDSISSDKVRQAFRDMEHANSKSRRESMASLKPSPCAQASLATERPSQGLAASQNHQTAQRQQPSSWPLAELCDIQRHPSHQQDHPSYPVQVQGFKSGNMTAAASARPLTRPLESYDDRDLSAFFYLDGSHSQPPAQRDGITQEGPMVSARADSIADHVSALSALAQPQSFDAARIVLDQSLQVRDLLQLLHPETHADALGHQRGQGRGQFHQQNASGSVPLTNNDPVDEFAAQQFLGGSSRAIGNDLKVVDVRNIHGSDDVVNTKIPQGLVAEHPSRASSRPLDLGMLAAVAAVAQPNLPLALASDNQKMPATTITVQNSLQPMGNTQPAAADKASRLPVSVSTTLDFDLSTPSGRQRYIENELLRFRGAAFLAVNDSDNSTPSTSLATTFPFHPLSRVASVLSPARREGEGDLSQSPWRRVSKAYLEFIPMVQDGLTQPFSSADLQPLLTSFTHAMTAQDHVGVNQIQNVMVAIVQLPPSRLQLQRDEVEYLVQTIRTLGSVIV